MKLSISILMALATVSLIVGIHQTMLYGGIEYSYVFFTFSAGFVLWIKYLKRNKENDK